MGYNVTNDNKRELIELIEQEPRIAYWEIAQVLGVHDNTVVRYMRMPSDDQAKLIKSAIKQIRASRK